MVAVTKKTIQPLKTSASLRAHEETPMLLHQIWLDRVEECLIARKARQLAAKARFAEEDVDDIKQMIRLDVLQRLAGFDQNKSNRHTFVKMVVRCRGATILKRWSADKRNGGEWPKSLNVTILDEEDDCEVELHETLAEDVRRPVHLNDEEHSDLVADVQHVMASLPDDLRPWCAVLVEPGMRKASRELGISYAKIRGIKKRIRAAFEKAGLEDYFQKK